MNDPVVSREFIALDADAAAQRFVASGIEASREWRRQYQISILKWSAARMGMGA